MKVLESGTGQKGWAQEFICTGKGNGNGGCDAKLLVEKSDVFLTYSHVRDEKDTFYTFRCPECFVWTDIPSPPFRVREKNPLTDGYSSGEELL